MKLTKRLNDLREKFIPTPGGYSTTLSDEEILEARLLTTLKDAICSQTDITFIDSAVAKYLANKLELDIRNLKKGKFHY